MCGEWLGVSKGGEKMISRNAAIEPKLSGEIAFHACHFLFLFREIKLRRNQGSD